MCGHNKVSGGPVCGHSKYQVGQCVGTISIRWVSVWAQ